MVVIQRACVLQSDSLHPPALRSSLARFKTATFPLIVGSSRMCFLAVVNASKPSIRTTNGGKFGQSSLFNDGSCLAWKIESADAPGVAAIISGVREIVSSATIFSSSMFRQRESDRGRDYCPVNFMEEPQDRVDWKTRCLQPRSPADIQVLIRACVPRAKSHLGSEAEREQ